MILFLEENNRIFAYNVELPKESVETFDNAVWYDGEFSFTMAEFIKGKTSIYYYENGKVRIEYVDIELPEEPTPSQLDRIESGVSTLLENGSAIDAMLGVTSYE